MNKISVLGYTNKQVVDANGCSQAQIDKDLDGVHNEIDLCPDTPLGVPVNADGCSDQQATDKNDLNDDDNDGVINLLDRCPSTP